MRREISSRSSIVTSGLLTRRSRNRKKRSRPTRAITWHNSESEQTLNFQGKYEQALTVLRAIPQEVNPALVGHQIAWALFNLGRKEEASATLEQFLRDYPEDNGGLFTSRAGGTGSFSRARTHGGGED